MTVAALCMAGRLGVTPLDEAVMQALADAFLPSAGHPGTGNVRLQLHCALIATAMPQPVRRISAAQAPAT